MMARPDVSEELAGMVLPLIMLKDRDRAEGSCYNWLLAVESKKEVHPSFLVPMAEWRSCWRFHSACRSSGSNAAT